MGRVLTNNTSMSLAREGTETVGSRGIGFLPGEDPGDGGGVIPGSPEWKQIEPNDIGTFGSTISTVARNPIRRSRGRLKGTISDLDSAVEFDSDLTKDSFFDLIEGFMFSTFNNDSLIFRAADVGTGTYTISAATAAQAGVLQSDANVDSLLFASGYTTAVNNGLKVLAADVATTDTTVDVVEAVTTETAPANAKLEIAGQRFAAGVASLAVAAAVPDVSGRIGTLTATGVDTSTLGASVGQIVYLIMEGTNQGFARINAIDGASNTITLDRMDAALIAASPAGTVDIRFGQFVRDVGSDQLNFLQRSFQFEASYPGLADNDVDTEYEYARGNFCSVLGISSELTDKSTFSAAFVGTDTDVPTGTRKTGAATALAPLGTTAFSTVADFARLRITDIDDDGLTSDFKSIELTIDNNVSPEKVLNRLGARFVNFGNFFVNFESSIIFSDGDVLSRIRQNTTVSLDLFQQNEDGVLAFSIASMTLGDGSKDLPVNETVLLNLSGEAFEDPSTGVSLGVSYIPSVT